MVVSVVTFLSVVFSVLKLTWCCDLLAPSVLFVHRLVGLVVKASTLRAEDLGCDSCLWHWNFSRLSHTSDLKIGIPDATLPGTRHYRVSAGTDWAGVSIL